MSKVEETVHNFPGKTLWLVEIFKVHNKPLAEEDEAQVTFTPNCALYQTCISSLWPFHFQSDSKRSSNNFLHCLIFFIISIIIRHLVDFSPQALHCLMSYE